jgi:hypothetical protein
LGISSETKEHYSPNPKLFKDTYILAAKIYRERPRLSLTASAETTALP